MKSLIVLALLVCGLSFPTRADLRDPETRSKIQRILSNHGEQSWQAIHWAADATDALQQAGRLNRPILVFIVVGKDGQAQAEQC